MNIFEWYSLRKKATDHPFFDAHPHMLSKKESDKTVKEQSTMSGKEFVDSIYAELGKERPNSSPEYTSSNREANKSIRTISIPRIRKVAIVLGTVLLFVLFFALTPSGRAMADNAIRFMFKVFDSSMVLEPFLYNKSPEVQIEEVENKQIESMINRFSIETGCTPVTLHLTCEDVQFDTSDGNYTCMLSYVTKEGFRIVSMQEWNLSSFYTIISECGFTQTNESNLYYSLDSSDNSILAILVLDDSLLHIYLDSPLEIEDLIDILHQSNLL